VRLGIDVLEASGFGPLRGKRVGLLTHPAGVNRRGVSTIEVLRRAPEVNLAALYGPEHGLYGEAEANEAVASRTDPRTGLPVHSLYGRYRHPTPAMLEGIDVLVIDLQDIGVRSYTYASSMRYAMESCFKNGVEVVVLDRPNPLGGLKADGPRLAERWKSYVGAFDVPYVHGLTIGELARIAKHTPGVMEVSERTRRRGKLTVVPMEGWKRSMLWPDTGLEWVSTSPNIPGLSAVLGYAMTGLGAQLADFSHGIGTPHPFRFLRYPGRSPREIEAALEGRGIRGLDFVPARTKTSAGASIEGVYVAVEDWEALRPTELNFHLMRLAAAWSEGRPFRDASASSRDLFNKHVGSPAWWKEISKRGADARVARFVEHWARSAREFHRRTRDYWLYPR